MTREISIITPENVVIEYELAGLGSRSLAYLYDVIIQGLILTIFGVIWFFTNWYALERLSPVVTDVINGVGIAAGFVFVVGYHIYYENKWNGQTPGKRSLRLRVIQDEGRPIDLSAAIIRNLIRLLEISFGFYVISLFFVLFSPRYKRVGDYAAGTIVVKEQRAEINATEFVPERIAKQETPEREYVQDVWALGQDEIAIIKRFVERRTELSRQAQEDIGKRIAQTIFEKTNSSPPERNFSYANYLEEVYNRLTEERGIL